MCVERVAKKRDRDRSIIFASAAAAAAAGSFPCTPAGAVGCPFDPGGEGLVRSSPPSTLPSGEEPIGETPHDRSRTGSISPPPSALKRRRRSGSRWDVDAPSAELPAPPKTSTEPEQAPKRVPENINTVEGIGLLRQKPQQPQPTEAPVYTGCTATTAVTTRLGGGGPSSVSPLGVTTQCALSSPTSSTASGTQASARVYVGNLPYKLTELELRALFGVCGAIVGVTLPLNAALGRHQGFAFVEFAEPAAADAALMLDGLVVMDRRINVSLPKNDNEYTSPSLDAAPASITNRDDRSMHKTHGAAACVAQCTRRSTPRRDGAAASAAAEATPLTPAGSTARANPCRVYVGNVKYSITEAEIGVLFACFGAVKSFNLVVSTAAMHANAHARAVTRGAEAVPHRGYGFVEYFTPKSAKSAVAAMNNLKLAGRPLKVGYAAPLNDPIKSAAAAVSQKISCNLRRATYHAHSVMSKDAVWNIIASRSSALRALSSCLRKSSACRG